jgi:hypothetical protein
MLRLLGGFVADEAAKPPAAPRGVFFRVLDHHQDRSGGAGDESLECPGLRSLRLTARVSKPT